MVFTALKLTVGLAVIAGVAVLQTLILLAVLPSRTTRIRSCIVFERLVGFSCVWLSGCRLSVTGREHLDRRRPAIYALNHTSLIDLFLVLRLMPYGSVGVAKKEVVRYPFFGQMYLLTGHLRIDRGHHTAAIASMRSLGDLVRRARLSIFITPEGTRSHDGRLLPFKKGLVHLALQTGLPVVTSSYTARTAPGGRARSRFAADRSMLKCYPQSIHPVGLPKRQMRQLTRSTLSFEAIYRQTNNPQGDSVFSRRPLSFAEVFFGYRSPRGQSDPPRAPRVLSGTWSPASRL